MADVPGDETPTVVVVDDDGNMREALRRLFRRAHLCVEMYESAGQFLGQCDLSRRLVLVLDVMMPGMTGLELQRTLQGRGIGLPTIFLSGASDIPMAVQAMREGAFDFLEKPFDPDQLLSRVRSSLDALPARPTPFPDEQGVRRLALLSPREREVMSRVATGKTSKEIAREFGTSYRTVELQRARLMRKLGASSIADLVNVWRTAIDRYRTR